jgi:cerevisin
MSSGGGKSHTLDDIAKAAVDSVLHFAVAAGNDKCDAWSFSPAGSEKAITVGTSTDGDERAYFSNYGPCVDIFAPDLKILSTRIGSDSANNITSDTSLASCHTAGLLAYLLPIYPHLTFDPRTSSLVPAEFKAQRPFPESFTSLYQYVYNVVPYWVSGFLPPPRLVEVVTAPSRVEPLSPTDLKAALIVLVSKG